MKRSKPILSAAGVSKKFSRSLRLSLGYGLLDIAREVTGWRRSAPTLRKSEFWALHDISFDLQRGETLALVGRNGSGKSTLLRLISGIIKPDTGRVLYNGRVAPLIALGAGFNPVLNGRENVFMNLAILGMSKKEILEQFDAVVDFAEIGDAIDAPLQTYSSGMVARLGFACAIHTHPDILLMDEVLSVGDANFRGKCYRKLYELRASGVSTILVTHNTNAVLSMAGRALYLSAGRKVMEGEPGAVMSRYEEDLLALPDQMERNNQGALGGARGHPAGLWIESVDFLDAGGSVMEPLISGQPARLTVRYSATKDIPQVGVGLLVRELSDENDVVLNLSSERDAKLFALAPGNGSLDLALPYVGLRPGLYTAKIYLSAPGNYQYDMVESYRFRVVAKDNMSQCLYFQSREWRRAEEAPERMRETEAGKPRGR
jgi:lipopolysaccharide transport system ATP-binding protein